MYIGRIYLVNRNEWINCREFKTEKEANEWVKMLTEGIYPVRKEDVNILRN